MPKFTKTIDGKEVTFEISNEEIASSGEFMHKDAFAAELSRRGVGIAKSQGYKLPDDLLNDPEFIKQALEKAGVKPGDSAQSHADAIRDALERQKRDLTEQQVKPLEQKLTAAEERENDLLNRDLHRQIIMAAGAAGVKKTMFKPGANGIPPIVAMLADNFGFDTETREFYVLNGSDAFAFSQLGVAGKPYMSVDEFITRWAQDKSNADFVESRGQAGPSLGGAGSGHQGGAGNPVRISKADSRNLRTLELAKAEARKRGLDPLNGGIVIED